MEAGEYGGVPYYRQRDTVTVGTEVSFLFKCQFCPGGNGWLVGSTLGEDLGGLLNRQNASSHPPTDQWLFYDGGEWKSDDNTLILEFTALSTCDLVRVAGQGGVVETQGESLGDYR